MQLQQIKPCMFCEINSNVKQYKAVLKSIKLKY